VKFMQRMWLLSLTIFLSSCVTSSSSRGTPPARLYPQPSPPTSLQLGWQDEGQRVCLSKEDAIKLMHWLLEVEAFLEEA
jgi:hypothetical protein